MVNLIIERDVNTVACAVLVEGLSISDMPRIASIRDSYLAGIRDKLNLGVFYRAEVDSVFVGVYIINATTRDIIWSKIRKTKEALKGQVDAAVADYFSSGDKGSASFYLQGGVQSGSEPINNDKV